MLDGINLMQRGEIHRKGAKDAKKRRREEGRPERRD
jgi:hypothetical protein